MRRTLRALGILVVLSWAASSATAGVVYEIEVKDHGQSSLETESIEAAVEGRHIKMGIASGGQGERGDMIFRGDRREMVVVDHQSQSYTVMDEEAIAALAGQVNSALAQMQEALKNVPEGQREMVEKMMKERMPPTEPTAGRTPSELVATGERADKNGYPCMRYEVLREGRKLRELWVTDWDNIDGGEEVAGAFEGMADFFRELMDAIPKMGAGGPGMDDSFFEHMKELGGFPIVTREFAEDGSLEAESTLRSASRRTLDPADFEPPSGYKRRQMFPGN